jgi:hypothetical protein
MFLTDHQFDYPRNLLKETLKSTITNEDREHMKNEAPTRIQKPLQSQFPDCECLAGLGFNSMPNFGVL